MPLPTPTPEPVADAEIRRLKADPAFREAWLTPGHVGHTEAVRRMTELSARAQPTLTAPIPAGSLPDHMKGNPR